MNDSDWGFSFFFFFFKLFSSANSFHKVIVTNNT